MEFFIEPLDVSHKDLFSKFYVDKIDGTDYFNNYLIYNGLLDQNQGIARTYLYIRRDDNENEDILGFYSVRASSLIIDCDNRSVGEPAIEIYELAVQKEEQKKGIGTQLIQDVIALAIRLANEIGIKYLLVCSKNNAVGFYEKCSFSKLPGYKDIPRTNDNSECVGMYLPLGIKNS